MPASSGACGACDACTPAAPWLLEHATPRVSDAPADATADAAQTEGAAPSAEFQRGDWVRVDGRHLGHVVRVEGEGKRTRLIVESAGDFRRRQVNPNKARVEKLQ